MNAKETAKINSFNAVIRQFKQEGDAAALEAIPALKAAISLFAAEVAGIAGATTTQQAGSAPETLTKAEARINLADLASGIAAQLFAWASQTGNTALKEEADISFAAFAKLKDALLPARAEAIHQLAMDNKEALVPFGVSNELLQSLTNATENFKEAAASPRNKIAKRSAGGKTIDAGIAAAGKILKEQIKKLMPGLKKTFPDVYNAFITNSKIVDAPGISKAAKAAKAANAKTAGDSVAANS